MIGILVFGLDFMGCKPDGALHLPRATQSESSVKSCRHWRRLSRRMALVSCEYAPCFQRARRLRSSLSGVRGPVLMPPCIRHRPFLIAGFRQAVRCRVRAPQRAFVETNGAETARSLPLVGLQAPRSGHWKALHFRTVVDKAVDQVEQLQQATRFFCMGKESIVPRDYVHHA